MHRVFIGRAGCFFGSIAGETAISDPRAPASDFGASDTGAVSASGGLDCEAVKYWLWSFAVQTPEHAILLLDVDLQVLWANAGAAEILGEPAAQIIGRSLSRFFTVEDRELGIPSHEVLVATRLGASEDDRWMQRADGSRFWASGRTVALAEGPAVFGFIKILRNETELKMRLQTFSNRLAALEHSESAQVAALATLSHELRNPLSALRMAAVALQRQPDPARATQMIDIIQRNVGFIARMTDDLELAVRGRVGKLTLHVEPLDLQAELQVAIDIAMARAGHPVRCVETLLPPGAPIRFDGDRVRIQQVLVNLLGNAIKFTGEGGHIWVKSTVEGPHVVVRVEDDGAGIAPAMLQDIFLMFTQAEGPDQQPDAGLGIGLALVRQIVELHGGSVQANSDGLGKGSAFTVRLPISQEAAPASEVL
jgi:two-component system CheB/CheR fusion protein